MQFSSVCIWFWGSDAHGGPRHLSKTLKAKKEPPIQRICAKSTASIMDALSCRNRVSCLNVVDRLTSFVRSGFDHTVYFGHGTSEAVCFGWTRQWDNLTQCVGQHTTHQSPLSAYAAGTQAANLISFYLSGIWQRELPPRRYFHLSVYEVICRIKRADGLPLITETDRP